MKIPQFILLLLFPLGLFAQVDTVMYKGKKYFVYPLQKDLSCSILENQYDFYDSVEVVQRDDLNRKIVGKAIMHRDSVFPSRLNYRGYMKKKKERLKLDEIKFINENPQYFHRIGKTTIDVDFDLLTDTLIDGEYIMFYKNIGYIKNRVLRYHQNIPYSIFTVVNGKLNGKIEFFNTIGSKMIEGYYHDNLKTDEWKSDHLNTEVDVNNNPDYQRFVIKDYDRIKEVGVFKDGLLNGEYTSWWNEVLLSHGYYQDNYETGDWVFYNIDSKNTNHQNKSNDLYQDSKDSLLVFSRVKYNDEQKKGKSVIVRPTFGWEQRNEIEINNYFEKIYFYDSTDHNRDKELYFDYSYFFPVNEPNKEFELNEPSSSYIEGVSTISYIYESDDDKKIRHDKKMNDYDSLGYLSPYNYYEQYYPNGQLKYKLELENGSLIKEPDIFYPNGKLASSVVYHPEKKQYQVRIWDYYENLLYEEWYDSIGRMILQVPKETERYYVRIENVDFEFLESTLVLTHNIMTSFPSNDQIDTIVFNRWKPGLQKQKLVTYDHKKREKCTQKYGVTGKLESTEISVFSEDFKTRTTVKNSYLANIRLEETSIDSLKESEFTLLMKKRFDSLPVLRINQYYYSYNEDKKMFVDDKLFTGKLEWKISKKGFSIAADSQKIELQIPIINQIEKKFESDLLQYDKTGEVSKFLDELSFFTHDGMNWYFNLFFGFYNSDIESRFYLNQVYNLYRPVEYKIRESRYFYKKEKTKFRKIEDRIRQEQIRLHQKHGIRIYHGEIDYFNGKIHGKEIAFYKNGSIASLQTHENGKSTGPFLEYDVYVPEKMGSFKYSRLVGKLKRHCKKHGDYFNAVYYQVDSIKRPFIFLKQEGRWKNGNYDGKHIEYNAFGDTVSFYNDSNVGLEGRVFNVFGNQRIEQFYTNGKKTGKEIRSCHQINNSWRKQTEFSYFENSLIGEFAIFHKNKSLAQKGEYLNGKVHGIIKSFDTLGKLVQTASLVNGLLTEIIEYENENENLKYQFSVQDSLYIFYERGSWNICEHDCIDDDDYYYYDHEVLFFDTKIQDFLTFPYNLTKFYPNSQPARSGQILNEKKTGLWTYFNYQGTKLSEVNYFDSLIQLNDSVTFKVKGIQSNFDEKGTLLAKSWVIEKFEKYDCAHADHVEERMLWCFWEKDSSVHRMNGRVKNYYENGALQSEGMVKNGLPTGIWKLYDNNGGLKALGEYLQGKRNGRWMTGDLATVKNMGDFCIDPNTKNFEALMAYEQKLRDISVIYYKLGKELKKEYYGINENNTEALDER